MSNDPRADVASAADLHKSDLHKRLTRLEELFMHLDRQYHELSEVLLAQSARLDALGTTIERLHRGIDSGGNLDEPGDHSGDPF